MPQHRCQLGRRPPQRGLGLGREAQDEAGPLGGERVLDDPVECEPPCGRVYKLVR